MDAQVSGSMTSSSSCGSSPPGPETAPPSVPAPSTTAPAHTVVKFNVEKANQLVLLKQWDSLEDYISTFISHHQKDAYPHPALFFSIYQAHVLSKIEAGEHEAAAQLFKDKVDVLSKDNGDRFWPFDLDDRIENLRDGISQRTIIPEKLPACATDNLQTAIHDYICLYFAGAVRPQSQVAPLFDFAGVVNVSGKKRYRCLACQWMVPIKSSIAALGYHLKHRKDHIFCPSVTLDLMNRLFSMDGKDDVVPDFKTLIEILKTEKVNNSSRKRSSTTSESVNPRVFPNSQLIAIECSSIVDCVSNLADASLHLVVYLQIAVQQTDSAEVLKVAFDIAKDQANLADQVRKLVVDSCMTLSPVPLNAMEILATVNKLDASCHSMLYLFPLVSGKARELAMTVRSCEQELMRRCTDSILAHCQKAEIANP